MIIVELVQEFIGYDHWIGDECSIGKKKILNIVWIVDQLMFINKKIEKFFCGCLKKNRMLVRFFSLTLESYNLSKKKI